MDNALSDIQVTIAGGAILDTAFHSVKSTQDIVCRVITFVIGHFILWKRTNLIRQSRVFVTVAIGANSQQFYGIRATTIIAIIVAFFSI